MLMVAKSLPLALLSVTALDVLQPTSLRGLPQSEPGSCQCGWWLGPFLAVAKPLGVPPIVCCDAFLAANRSALRGVPRLVPGSSLVEVLLVLLLARSSMVVVLPCIGLALLLLDWSLIRPT